MNGSVNRLWLLRDPDAQAGASASPFGDGYAARPRPAPVRTSFASLAGEGGIAHASLRRRIRTALDARAAAATPAVLDLHSEGCGMWIVDFVTVAAQSMPLVEDLRRVTGHELGHATNLWRIDASDNADNLMAVPRPTVPDVMTYRLYDWQVLLVRASKHVSYF